MRYAYLALTVLSVVLASGSAASQSCPPQRDVQPGTCVCPPGTVWRNMSQACDVGRCINVAPAPPVCPNGCGPGQVCVNGVCVGTGDLRFTLTWDRPGDMDLHVVTPAGHEIYYAAQNFDQGQLDHDDTRGTGPENVFWSHAPPGGAYLLCVDPYNITGPTQFQLTVAISGTPTRTITGVRNGSERGACARNSPNFVAEVSINGPVVPLPPVVGPIQTPGAGAYHWVASANGMVPPGAVEGGREANRMPLYVCRARFNGGVHPGKVVGRNCNISWGGAEVTIPNYEVLIGPPGRWVAGSGGTVPPGAFIAGNEANGAPLALCHGYFNGGLHPGKLVGQNCNVGWGGAEQLLHDYEVFVP